MFCMCEISVAILWTSGKHSGHGVGVGVRVREGVAVAVGVRVGEGVRVGVNVFVGVRVFVGVVAFWVGVEGSISARCCSACERNPGVSASSGRANNICQYFTALSHSLRVSYTMAPQK